MLRLATLSILALSLLTAPALAALPETGTVKVDCNGDAKCGIPERYRVPNHTFDFKLALRHDLRHSGVKVYDLSFPSPVKSDIPENNTVYAELFMPAGRGPFPASIVLDILQGDALIARGQAMWLAQHGVAGMVVYMAHYGPRRPPGSRHDGCISTDIPKTIAGVQQTVQDVRCAVAWLADRPEIDANQLGLAGTSLGSFVGAVVAANEPRIKNVCLMLGGGGLVDAYYDHPLAKQYLPLVELARREGRGEGAHRPGGPVDVRQTAEREEAPDGVRQPRRHRSSEGQRRRCGRRPASKESSGSTPRTSGPVYT